MVRWQAHSSFILTVKSIHEEVELDVFVVCGGRHCAFDVDGMN